MCIYPLHPYLRRCSAVCLLLLTALLRLDAGDRRVWHYEFDPASGEEKFLKLQVGQPD